MNEKINNEFKNMHPRTVEILYDMQSEKVACINCGTITNTCTHVDNNGGIMVFTKYVCPHCKKEFMEKDLYEIKN